MKKIFLAGILFLSLQDVLACDICGCSSGSYFIGPFPQFHKHFIGTRYTFRSFKSVMKDDPDQFSEDFYQTIELWGGWNIDKKWQVLGFIPFNFNRQNSDDGLAKSSGLGDISFILNYNLLNKQSKDKGGNMVNHQLWIGGGIKLPSGKFSPDVNDIIPEANNQVGSGSVDYVANAVYALHVRNWGINSSAEYKINTEKDQYHFGDRFSSSVLIFRSFGNGNTVLNPNVGLLYENLQSNKLNGAKVPDSGGHALLAAAGLDVNFNKISIGFNTQLPVIQNFSNDQTKAKIKGMLHLTLTI